MPPPKKGHVSSSEDEEPEGAELGEATGLRFEAPNPEEFIKSLAPLVQRRIRTLQKLNEEHKKLEDDFRKELHELEVKYYGLYAPLYSQRSRIVTGEVEPTDEEAGVSLEELKKLHVGDAEKKVEVTDLDDEKKTTTAEEQVVGIPEFWLSALKNHQAFAENITEKDEAVLKFLKDLKCDMLPDGKKGFKLTFIFDENPHFTNTELTKTYVMMDEEEMMLDHAEGTPIDWKPGKNITVKILKKKQKGKGRKPDKVVTKTEPTDSFFNFFAPPKMPEEELDAEEEEQLQEALEADFELGSQLKDRIIPHAVKWYTGEALADELDEDDEEGEDEDEEDDDEDEEEEDDDDEDDDDDEPKAKSGKKGKPHQAGPTGKARAPGVAGEQPECKQQ
eukprot:CAMPEP_0196660148 /NCGR_PEP_ID=MMETSP1086-20130531/38352_1 /TAXON_ID=77921 /ORGANISM="Cyanoptyche  gloeocystis , Strain SAG4.97" /LENGTH=389 /DNA_ID=CAMNT_0041994425 /DNA_START=56 /DNA_END=1225 /DNA_ORIENTATION=+